MRNPYENAKPKGKKTAQEIMDANDKTKQQFIGATVIAAKSIEYIAAGFDTTEEEVLEAITKLLKASKQ